MAYSILDMLAGGSTIDQIRQNTYEKYKDKFKDSTDDLVNSETFLNLMVSEMTNQDPLEPTSNTEFITQLASFSQLSYARDSSAYSMANYASSLVGKVVTATKPDGKDQITKTGVVESVAKQGDTYNVFIDGVAFDIAKVTKVQPADGTGAGTLTSGALGDSIARASGMIGMYATVPTKGEDGAENGLAAGWVDTVRVKDGKLVAVLADEEGNTIGEYELDKITEITYAAIGTDDTESTSNAISNALADSISRASGMIGMFAKTPTDDGIVSGIIDTIKVKDGRITAVLADEEGNTVGEFDLSKLTEITYAAIASGNDGITNADKVDDSEIAEEEDKPVGAAEGIGGTDMT